MRPLSGLLAVLAALALTTAPAQATFPGKNGRIAFAQRAASGGYEPGPEHARLLVTPLGRGGDRVLLDCEITGGVPSGGDCTGTTYTNPSYSPDGETIVFDAGTSLATINADGGQPALLPAATLDDGDPCFSADGQRIVFTGANGAGGTDLYIRRLDGGPARLIIHDAAEPAWSSRDRLAYVRSGNVYTAGPLGGRRRWVTSGVTPDWSPGGHRLLLVRPLPQAPVEAPNGRLYVVGAAGRGLHQVGRSTNISNPVWSPDARWVAYDGFDLGVYVRRLARGAHPREVAPTQVSGENGTIASFHPAWRPR
jgi:TolB protein